VINVGLMSVKEGSKVPKITQSAKQRYNMTEFFPYALV
jgi:hypothetical protein